MAASEVDAREAPSEDVGSGQKPFAAEASPLASEMRAAKTVVGAESETVGPRTPAMSDEADGGEGDDVEDVNDIDDNLKTERDHLEDQRHRQLQSQQRQITTTMVDPETIMTTTTLVAPEVNK